jgi:serine/threonine-protein kinase
MNCSRCGAEVQREWKACPQCGLSLASTTPIQAILQYDVAEIDLVREALANEYELIEELGRGGMAVVYRAKEKQLEREVAVKVLPFSLSFDTEFVERFEREARTAAALEHPNIIPIYRVGHSGKVAYFAMKLLRGDSLSGLLTERGRLEADEIRGLLIQTASALGHAHKRGIVHRDVKPDNIMFDEFGGAIMTDFGIAKAVSGQRLTGTGMSIGTPHYMSPEQARAQDLDGRCDIYSLGVVAYQCLTGAVPFDGEDAFAIGYRHIMDPIPKPTLSSPEERRLYEIIWRMLQKEPGERYQSCEKLIAELGGGTGGASVMGTSVAGAGTPRPGGPVPVGSGPSPTIRSQPTTPLPQVVAAESPPPALPIEWSARPVAKRSPAAAAERKSSGFGWLWLAVVALAGGGGAAAYHFKVGPFAEPAAREPLLISAAPDSGQVRAAAAGDSLTVEDSIAGPVVTQTSLPEPAVARNPTPPPTVRPTRAPRDSGAIRIRNLPAGSQVLIDERDARTATTRLPVGSHVIAVIAPRYNFYTDTVTIRPNELVLYEPQLSAFGEPARDKSKAISTRAAPHCNGPTLGYNVDNICFVVAPRPLAETKIPIPANAPKVPRATRLLIHVRQDGGVAEVRSLRPSDVRVFEAAARGFARSLKWSPATKGGVPVDAWTPWEFTAVRR